MNKEAAEQLMLEGVKITHENFGDEEWMMMGDDAKIVLEDGVKCYPHQFWFDRTNDSWDDGYSVWKDLEERREAPSMGLLSSNLFDHEPFYLTNPYSPHLMDHMYRGGPPKVRKGPKLRRNDLCSCGSGLKYKKCCLIKNLNDA